MIIKLFKKYRQGLIKSNNGSKKEANEVIFKHFMMLTGYISLSIIELHILWIFPVAVIGTLLLFMFVF